MKKLQIGLFAALFAILSVGCTEVTQTIEPSPVSIDVNAPGTTSVGDPPPTTTVGGTIELEPPNGEVAVGKNLNVMVIVRDTNGQEVPSENITIAIANLTIVRLVEIDGRTIALEGLAVGSTSVIVSASGLQTSMVVAVVP